MVDPFPAALARRVGLDCVMKGADRLQSPHCAVRSVMSAWCAQRPAADDIPPPRSAGRACRDLIGGGRALKASGRVGAGAVNDTHLPSVADV